MAETATTNARERVIKAALLIGRLVELQAAGKPPKSIVVLAAVDQQVDQVKPDGTATGCG